MCSLRIHWCVGDIWIYSISIRAKFSRCNICITLSFSIPRLSSSWTASTWRYKLLLVVNTFSHSKHLIDLEESVSDVTRTKYSSRMNKISSLFIPNHLKLTEAWRPIKERRDLGKRTLTSRTPLPSILEYLWFYQKHTLLSSNHGDIWINSPGTTKVSSSNFNFLFSAEWW